jgi:hypothetical protein
MSNILDAFKLNGKAVVVTDRVSGGDHRCCFRFSPSFAGVNAGRPSVVGRSLMRLGCISALMMAGSVAIAQPPAEMLPDAAVLKKYDANRNARLDPAEIAVLQAHQKSGQFTRDFPGHEPHVAWAWITVEHCSSARFGALQYKATLLPDDLVIFEGHDQAKAAGRLTKQIDPAKAAAIFSRIDEIGLGNREPSPTDAGSSDFASDNIVVSANGTIRALENWPHKPKAVREFFALFYEATGLDAWIGKQPERSASPPP